MSLLLSFTVKLKTHRHVWRHFPIILSGFLWFLLTYFPLQNFDIWTHLATGRWISEHGAIPRTDIFSFTAYGHPWITHEWAAQLIFYQAFKLISIKGLVLLKAIICFCVGLILSLYGIKQKNNPWFVSIIGGITAYLVAVHAFVRPHIFSYLFFSLVLVAVYLPLNRSGKTYIAIAALFIIWSNLHAGVIYGLMLVFYRTAANILRRVFSRKSQADQIKSDVFFSFASLGSSFINPNTYHALSYPFLFFRHSYLFSLISELRPIYDKRFTGADFLFAYAVLSLFAIVIFSAVIFQKGNPGILQDVVLFLLFLFFSVNSMRNIPFFAILSMGLILKYAPSLKPITRIKSEIKPILSLITGIILSLLIVRTIQYGTDYGKDGPRNIPTSTFILSKNYPMAAARFIDSVKPGGHIFNAFSFGSYLIWHLYPQPDVFIDGRLFLFKKHLIRDYINMIQGNKFNELVRKYGIGYCILPLPTRSILKKRNIYDELMKSDEWNLVYWDDNALIYARSMAANKSILERYTVTGVNPLQRTLTDIIRQCRHNPDIILMEVQRLYEFDPSCITFNILGGFAAFEAQRWKSVIYYLKKVVSNFPENIEIRYRLGYAYQSLKNIELAEEQYIKGLRTHPDHYRSLFQLAMLYHRQGKFFSAEKYYRRAYLLNDKDPILLQNMGILYAEHKEYDKAESLWRKALALDPESPGIRFNLKRLDQLRNKTQ